jgi:hypothetical protein
LHAVEQAYKLFISYYQKLIMNQLSTCAALSTAEIRCEDRGTTAATGASDGVAAEVPAAAAARGKAVAKKQTAKKAAARSKPPPAKRVATTNKATRSAVAAKASAASHAKDAAAKAAKKPAKLRSKLVRDSFTMPEADFGLIASLKSRALDARRAAKKSELLRAGLHLLASLQAKALVAELDKLDPVKIGRPKKGH